MPTTPFAWTSEATKGLVQGLVRKQTHLLSVAVTSRYRFPIWDPIEQAMPTVRGVLPAVEAMACLHPLAATKRQNTVREVSGRIGMPEVDDGQG